MKFEKQYQEHVRQKGDKAAAESQAAAPSTRAAEHVCSRNANQRRHDSTNFNVKWFLSIREPVATRTLSSDLKALIVIRPSRVSENDWKIGDFETEFSRFTSRTVAR